MFDRLLLPTDGSDGVEAVFDQVLDIAATHEATLHILNVADTTHDSVTRIGDSVIDVFEEQGETLVADTAAHANERGIDTETAVVQGGVAKTITEYAAAADIDCIVMPTHGREGIEELILGSTTERVSRLTTVPVLTLHPDSEAGDYPFESLLVPTDGSEPASIALQFAVDLAEETAAAIHLLSAIDTAVFGAAGHAPQHLEALQAEAREVVDAAADLAATTGIEPQRATVEHGTSVSGTIRSYAAEEDIDCIVMGTHGRTGLDRYLMGSVTESTLRSAAVPVFVVPSATAEDADGQEAIAEDSPVYEAIDDEPMDDESTDNE
jgi:nucleotide-binding universal stress UspA family protein